MPELPEVETLCRQLNERIAGQKILATDVYDDKLASMASVRRRIVIRVRRHGKTIVLMLDDGRRILIHLRMTGRLFWHTAEDKPPHSRWRITFTGGNVDLVDPRRFATIKVESTPEENEYKDLLTGFDEKGFLEKQAKRKVSVKILLMDPKAIDGIGNIYACEILHRSGISPLRQAAELSKEEWRKIFRNARRILKKGIEKRGTSISDWRDLYGCQGENQNELNIYGQEGKTCRACGGVITRIKQGGRSTFYCSHCQN